MDFKAPYNRNEYIDFFRRQLLPEDFQDHSEDIAVGFKSHLITKAVKIGEVPSLELQIYEVSHPSENDPRVSLSRDAFRLLAHYGAKRALIIFNSENSQNFRLSLVTIDLKWEEGKRVQKEYSNPRRYSFFLGPETRTHTPEEYLIKQGRVKDFDDLKGRFSIEVVNKEFYTQIAILFTQLAGGKREIGRKSIDAGRGLLNLPSTVDDTLDKEFTVRLIGRLVFCWFLKKKRSDKNISLLPEELLSAKAVSENKGYYHAILEPLFFEVLNTPVDSRAKKYKSSPWTQIPFLNGGLFTPHLHDYYDPGPLGISKHINTLKVPDHWIKELFEVFETYNFTIDENTSVDVELSIEPEMLGRIFENLLAEINPETGETARKATGSYYTPRPIVEYMVDESLKQYLLTKTKLEEEKITRLLTYEDVEVKLTDSEKESILTALDTIKIIDPACGSGAFPMGILQKMLLILQKVDPDSEWWLDTKLSQIESKLLKKELGKKLKAENVNYVHKLGIIQSSIYGVDIQPIAVEISKLRFFLSLIVDENVDDPKENRGIEPLPNLEFKFVCANSLIGLPKKDSQQTLFEATDDIKALRDLRDDYLRSYGDEKKRIEKKFQEVQSRMFKHSIGWGGKDSQTLKLAQWNPFSEEPCSWFDPDWMFGVKDGFDIVIGNPPYGFRDVLSKDEKLYFRKVEKIEFRSGDSAELFAIKCFENYVKTRGIMTFIIPKKSLYGDSWEILRKKFWDYYQLVFFLDASKAFDNVLLEANAFGLVKAHDKQKIKLSHLAKSGDVKEFACVEKKKILLDNGTFQIYTALYPESMLQKIQQKSSNEKIIAGVLGLAIGQDFFSDEKTDYKLLKGIDIERWVVKQHRWLKNKKRLDWEQAERFLKPKVLSQRVVAHIENPTPHIKITACYDEEGIIITNTLMSFDLDKRIDPKSWLAYLNSSFVSWYAYNFIYCRAIRTMDFYDYYIQQLPIPAGLLTNDAKHLINLADQIIRLLRERDSTGSSKKKLEEFQHQIDQTIYDLYGLTKKEIEIVEKTSEGK